MSDDLPIFDRRTLMAGMLATGAAFAQAQTGWAKTGGPSEYELARELYRYAYPLIFFGRYRHNSLTNVDLITRQPMSVNQWSHSDRTVTPESTGAPQTDTLYSVLLGDLTQGPLLLDIPEMDGRYWSIQCCDFFGSTFAMINRRNTSGPVTVGLVGPQWQGPMPEGASEVYRSPLPLIVAVIRIHFVSEADRRRVMELQAQFSATPMTGRIAKASRGSDLVVPSPRGSDPLADFKLLAAMWSQCPPPSSDQAYLERFGRIGFDSGSQPDINDLSAESQAALAQAEADGFAEILAAAAQVPGSLTSNGWIVPNPDLGLYHKQDHLYRAVIAQLGILATPVSENVYMTFQKLADGRRMNGGDRFEIIFDPAALTEVGAFWSIHAYNLLTTAVIPNAINRYSISSRSEGLKFGSDGSLTIYVQSDDPGGDLTSNWLPTRPDEDVMLITRAYEPQGRIAELTWSGPQVRRK